MNPSPRLSRIQLADRYRSNDSDGSDGSLEHLIGAVKGSDVRRGSMNEETDEEGYEYEFVDADEAKRYECPICLLTCRNPSQTECGHRFCQYCIHKWTSLNEQTLCPVCNEVISDDGRYPFPDNHSKREIRQLKVYCINKLSGCMVITVIAKIQDHISQCEYTHITCPQGCATKHLIRQDLQHHLATQCPNRSIRCQFCNQLVTYKNIQAHYDSACPQKTLSCEYCSESHTRHQMPSHHMTCIKYPIDCQYQPFGCSFKLRREEILSHNKVLIQHHMKLLAEAILVLYKHLKLTTKLYDVSQRAPMFPQIKSHNTTDTDSHALTSFAQLPGSGPVNISHESLPVNAPLHINIGLDWLDSGCDPTSPESFTVGPASPPLYSTAPSFTSSPSLYSHVPTAEYPPLDSSNAGTRHIPPLPIVTSIKPIIQGGTVETDMSTSNEQPKSVNTIQRPTLDMTRRKSFGSHLTMMRANQRTEQLKGEHAKLRASRSVPLSPDYEYPLQLYMNQVQSQIEPLSPEALSPPRSPSKLVRSVSEEGSPGTTTGSPDTIISLTGVHGYHKKLQQKVQTLEMQVSGLNAANINLEVRLSRSEARVECLESQLEEWRYKCCQGVLLWKIDNFSRKHAQAVSGATTALHSPGFYTSVDGYKFCMRLNPNGVDSATGVHLSAFIHLMQGDNDNFLLWPFSGTITITILNQDDQSTDSDRKHITDTLVAKPHYAAFKRPTANRTHKGFGYTKFAPIAMAMDPSNGYLRGDSLMIKVEIKVSS